MSSSTNTSKILTAATVLASVGALYVAYNRFSKDVKEELKKRQNQAHSLKHIPPRYDAIEELFKSIETPEIRNAGLRCKPKKGFDPSKYQHIDSQKLISKLPIALIHRCITYCNLQEVLKFRRISKHWKAFIEQLLLDRSYIRRCALRGFGDENARSRGLCWKVVCGSEKVLRQVISEHKHLYQDILACISPQAGDIEKDTARTLIHYGSFSDEKEAQRVLANLLKAYSIHDKTVGYCQGMNFLAAFLLTKLEEQEAYWTFFILLNSSRYNFRYFFLRELEGLVLCRKQFRRLFEMYLPQLFHHITKVFSNEKEIIENLITEWYMTLFTAVSFPKQTTNRLWDYILLDGVKAIHRIALAIFHLSQDVLLAYDFEGILMYVKKLPNKSILDPDILIKTAKTFRVTNFILNSLVTRPADRFPPPVPIFPVLNDDLYI